MNLSRSTDAPSLPERMSITIRSISHTEIEALLPAFIEALQSTVHGGSPMGFLVPLSYDTARHYWMSLCPELERGSRVLLVAFEEGRIVGTGQLQLVPWQNAQHRAEVHKLFVSESMRGRGVGRLLMRKLHDAALERGRTLILLSTRSGEPSEQFYKGLGYREGGVIPGYTFDEQGARFAHMTLYQELTQ